MNGIPRIAPGVVVEELDPDLCLFRPDIDEVVMLNQTAADVVRLVDGETSIETILDRLTAVYDASPTSIEPEVRRVLQDLQQRGYLEELVLPSTSATSGA